MFQRMTKRHNLIIIFIVLIGFIVRCYNLNEPFIGIHDWGSASLSRGASSLLRYGFFNLKGAPVWNIGVVLDDGYNYYLHWPLLMNYLLAISFKIFGIHEWSGRIVSVLFGTASIYLIYLICTKLYGKAMGYFGSILFALLPLNVYFNRMVGYETTSVYFLLLCAYLYLMWVDSQYSNKRVFSWLIITFIIGTQVHWQNYFIAVFVVFHWLIQSHINKNKNGKEVFLFPILSVILFILNMVYISWVEGAHGLFSLVNALKFRLNVSDGNEAINSISISQYISVLTMRFYHYFTIVVSILLVIWLIYIIIDIIKNRNMKLRFFELSLFLLGVSWIVIFVNHSYVHEFALLEMSAVSCVLVSSGFNSLLNDLRKYGQTLKMSLNDNIFAIITCLIIFIPFLTQSYVETKKLHAWHGDLKPLYQLGIKIGQNTKEDSVILADFRNPGPPTIEYYANRNIIYNINDRKTITKYINDKRVKYVYYITSLDKAIKEYSDYSMLPIDDNSILICLTNKSYYNGHLKKIVLDGTLGWEVFGERDGFKIVRVNLGLEDQPYLIKKDNVALQDCNADKFDRGGLSDIYNKNKYLYISVSDDESNWSSPLYSKQIKEYFSKKPYILYIVS